MNNGRNTTDGLAYNHRTRCMFRLSIERSKATPIAEIRYSEALFEPRRSVVPVTDFGNGVEFQQALDKRTPYLPPHDVR